MGQKIFCQRCGAECEEFLDGDILRSHCPSCGFIYYKNPYPCVSVFVVDDYGRVLMGKRGKESIYPDKWCIPCGYIEYEETYVEAAYREVKEETGIEIKPLRIINVVSNHLDNHVNSIVTVILAKPVTTDVKPGDDMVEVKWFDVLHKEIPELAFKADAFIINEYINCRKNNMEMQGIELHGDCFNQCKC